MPQPVLKTRILCIGILLFLFQFYAYSQQEDHDHQHDHNEVHNELATGGGIAFSTESEGAAPAFHFHGIKGISPKFGLGLGYEVILSDEIHQSLAALFSYKPHEIVDVNIGPGIIFPTEGESLVFALSAELAVTGHIGDHLHIGPMIDLGLSRHGVHFISGIHIGIDL